MVLPTFISRKKAAELLCVSVAAIRTGVRKGHLRGLKLGGRQLIRSESVMRLLRDDPAPCEATPKS